jgi:hypothetical protein
MEKYLVCVILSFGLLGSSVIPANANPASPACQKVKKKVLADEAQIKKLYKLYAPAEGKTPQSLGQKNFDFYYSKFIAWDSFALKAYGSMKKTPECFTTAQFKMVSTHYSIHTGMAAAITKEWLIANSVPFNRFLNEAIYDR